MRLVLKVDTYLAHPESSQSVKAGLELLTEVKYTTKLMTGSTALLLRAARGFGIGDLLSYLARASQDTQSREKKGSHLKRTRV